MTGEQACVAQTLAEKLIARAAGRVSVTPGEVVTCRVDLAMMHDSGGPRRVKPLLESLGASIWDPARVVVVSDHFSPAGDDESAAILDITRSWVATAGVENFHDGEGICHVVLPERGYLRPGQFVVGGDSHSPTGGAFGCYMFGVGATDMAAILATGETWLQVPETLRIDCNGRFAPGVVAKDLILYLIATLGLGGAAYRAVEFTGTAISSLAMAERMTLCNMTAELGAQTGLIAPDEVTAAYLRTVGVKGVEPGQWYSDPQAPVSGHLRVNVSALEPQVAAPHSPANAVAISELFKVSVDRCYIGACTGAKLVDLQVAADVVRGRRIAESTRFLVAPASAQVAAEAEADGTLAALVGAGADILPTGCGACAGYGGNLLQPGEVCLSSTARNFQGRMGAMDADIYLASPGTVAASAITGRITDPRSFIVGGGG